MPRRKTKGVKRKKPRKLKKQTLDNKLEFEFIADKPKESVRIVEKYMPYINRFLT